MVPHFGKERTYHHIEFLHLLLMGPEGQQVVEYHGHQQDTDGKKSYRIKEIIDSIFRIVEQKHLR